MRLPIQPLLTFTTAILVFAGANVAALDNPASEPSKTPGVVLWKHRVGAQIWSPLTLDHGSLYFGCDNGKVTALDLDARTVRWEFTSAGRVRSAVLCAGKKAIFASDDGYLYALDLKTGQELWRFDLGSQEMQRVLPATTPPFEYDYLHSSPAVMDSTIYIGSMNGHLYAVGLETGQERWRFRTRGKIRATPTIHAGTVYFGSWDGSLYAVDTASGEQRWKYDTGGMIQSSVAIGAGKVVFGSRSTKIYALNAASGEVAWQYTHPDGSWVESSPVVHDGVVYVGSSDALKLFTFDLATGKKLWDFKTKGWSWGTPVVTQEVVYIGGISASPYYFPGVDLEAGFHAVDRQTGELRWSMVPKNIEGYITGGVFSLPVRQDRIIYVGGLDGYVYALQE